MTQNKQTSDLSKHLREMVELSKEIDIPLKNGTIGLTPETIIKSADQIDRLENKIIYLKVLAVVLAVAFMGVIFK